LSGSGEKVDDEEELNFSLDTPTVLVGVEGEEVGEGRKESETRTKPESRQFDNLTSAKLLINSS
jgi:hypothetical protein